MKKKSRRSPNTPRSRIKNALRLVWMRSRERLAALQSTAYHCASCGVKQTMPKDKAKRIPLEVHHDPPINWEGIVDLVEERLLRVPQVPLCKPCHAAAHSGEGTPPDRIPLEGGEGGTR